MTISPAQIEIHLALLSETLPYFQRARDTLDEAGLVRQPAPGEWSVVEVLAHLRASADVFGQTIYMCLMIDKGTVPYVHPNEWMAMQGYASVPFDENWQIFQLNRRQLLRKLNTLTPDQWERSCTIKTQVRTVYGEMRRMALHEKGHYSQIEALYKEAE